VIKPMIFATVLALAPTCAFAWDTTVTNHLSANASAFANASARSSSRALAFSSGGNASTTNILANQPQRLAWWQGQNAFAVAPSAAAGANVCSSTMSFAAGFIGSLSFGYPKADADCNLRAWLPMVPKAVRTKLVCQSSYVNAAYRAAGSNACDNVTIAY
jgi:hypothetical protein